MTTKLEGGLPYVYIYVFICKLYFKEYKNTEKYHRYCLSLSIIASKHL